MSQVTIKEVRSAFRLLYKNIHEKEFRKSLPLNHWKERDLLPITRSFLLGYFGRVAPEYEVPLPGNGTGYGRVDFLIGDVAVEFAVRRPFDQRGPLSAKVNSNEIKKLMMYDGLSVLVLFDFSKSPFKDQQLEGFRDWPTLGRGKFNRSAFNVSYHYIESAKHRRYEEIYKNVHVQ
jgi:hypothetical protein